MIANTIIKAALRKLLVIPSGGTPTAAQYADGLEVLNDLIKSWGAEHNLIYEDSFEELTIPISTQSITIGSTGTLVTGRPLEILTASLKDGNEEDLLDIMDRDEYSRIENKTIVSQPTRIYYRNSWPNGTIYFDYTTDQEYTLVLSSLKQLAEFSDGTTDNPLPAYYERALKTNLTIELADEFGAGNRITQSMIFLAEQAKNAIIGQSLSINEAITELSGHGQYNIAVDSY